VCSTASEPCYYDESCPGSGVGGGLGCNAAGYTKCRFCGFKNYPACPGYYHYLAQEKAVTHAAETKDDEKAKEEVKEDKWGYFPCTATPAGVCSTASEPCYYDESCPGSGVGGGLGCNAAGYTKCRFCGFKNYPACPGYYHYR